MIGFSWIVVGQGDFSWFFIGLEETTQKGDSSLSSRLRVALGSGRDLLSGKWCGITLATVFVDLSCPGILRSAGPIMYGLCT
jgi:hypothetical protein